MVDPWVPCHMYMLAGVPRNGSSVNGYEDTYPYAVYRGDISAAGTTWNELARTALLPEDQLHAVPDYAPGAFLSVQSANAVWLPDIPESNLSVGNIRLLRSADAGNSWGESDEGLAVQDPTSEAARIIWAPSDPRTGYLVRASGYGFTATRASSLTLDVTTDGGQTWQPRSSLALGAFAAAPAHFAAVDDFAVDPINPHRIFSVSPAGGGAEGGMFVLESDDGGTTWSRTSASGTPNPAYPVKLVVTDGPGRSPVLYYLDFPLATDNGTATWLQSRDLGTNWKPIPVPATQRSGPYGFTLLAADPLNPDSVVWVSAPGNFDETSRTYRSRTVIVASSNDGFQTAPTTQMTLSAGTDSFYVDSLQTDRSGDFFVALKQWNETLMSGVAPRSRVLAFRPSALSGSLALAQTIGSSPSQNPPIPPAQNLRQETALATCATSAGNGGSVAFDGRFIDYTNDQATPGTIFRVDANCIPGAPLVLRAADFPAGKLPPLVSLTYDPLYPMPDGRTGAILAGTSVGFDPRVDPARDAVYAIDPVSGASVIARFAPRGVGCSAWPPYDCFPSSFFSYDIFHDRLLTWGFTEGSGSYGSNDSPGWWSTNGAFTPMQFCAALGVGEPNDSGAMATVGGADSLFVGLENDITIAHVGYNACDVRDAFAHNNLTENPQEDEQMTCDALSFQVPVVWARNNAANAVEAYPVSDAVCPFPTRLAYEGPATVVPGAAMRLCFTLTVNLADQWGPLATMPVSVRAGGRAVGAAATDTAGMACETTTAPASPGPVAVQGSFAGTAGYLPSSADGVVLVVGNVPGGDAPSVAAQLPLPPVTHVPPPSAVNQPEAAVESESQAQVQSIVQSQTQAQSQAATHTVAQVQPGVMLQQRTREQVATQTAGIPQADGLLASRRASAAVSLAVTFAGLLLLSVARLARRPRLAASVARRARPH